MASTPEVQVECRPEANGFRCRVEVGEGAGATEHLVTVTRADLAELAPGHPTPEELVRASFRFLLEREPASSILRSFDLPVIERYFPDYRREIATRLAGTARR
jgi:hypothetical protein